MSAGGWDQPSSSGGDRASKAAPRRSKHSREADQLAAVVAATAALIVEFRRLVAGPVTDETATYVADMERTIKLQLRAILRQRKGPRAKTQHDRLKRDFEAVQAMAARRMHRAPQSYAQRHGVRDMDPREEAELQAKLELAEHEAALQEEAVVEEEERSKVMAEVARDMQGIHEIMNDLAGAVDESRGQVDDLELHVEDTEAKAAQSVVTLADASKNSNRAWTSKVAAGFATVFGAIGLVGGVKGVAAGAAVGGLAGGALAKRSANKLNRKADAAARAVKDRHRLKAEEARQARKQAARRESGTSGAGASTHANRSSGAGAGTGAADGAGGGAGRASGSGAWGSHGAGAGASWSAGHTSASAMDAGHGHSRNPWGSGSGSAMAAGTG